MRGRIRHTTLAYLGFQMVLYAANVTGVADGAAVATWTPSTGTSITPTGASTQQPLYRHNSINGQPALQFDGVNDVMALDAAGKALTNNKSGLQVIAVAVYDATGADASQAVLLISTGSSTSSSRASLRIFSSSIAQVSGIARRLDADSLLSPAAIGTTSVPVIAELECDWANNSFTVIAKGVKNTPTSWGSGGNSSATDSLAAFIGGQASTANRLGGRIGAIAMAAPMVNPSVMARARGVMSRRFRISL